MFCSFSLYWADHKRSLSWGFETWRGWHGKQLLMQCWFSRNKIIYLYFFHPYQRQRRIKVDVPADGLIKACSAHTACLPAASSVGSMHQNRFRHDATFHLQPLESYRYIWCPLPFHLPVCFAVSPHPKHIICHLDKLFPLSLDITAKHIFCDLQRSRVVSNKKTRLHIIQWPWLHGASLLMSPQ